MLKKDAKNIKDTAEIAKAFLSKILKKPQKNALVVGLSGELGAGKTVFTQAVAKHLGIKRHVNSPTFVIMKKYPIQKGQYKFLFHLDAYRLKNEKELLHLGWEEIISNKENLVFIEWPENIIKIMPQKHYKILISHLPRLGKTGTKEGHRKFQIKML